MIWQQKGNKIHALIIFHYNTVKKTGLTVSVCECNYSVLRDMDMK